MAALQHILQQNRLIDTNGIADASEIYFYQSGTLTPAAVYTDSALTTEHSHPITVAAGAAVPEIWLDGETTYRRRIVYPDGSVDDTDPYQGLAIAGMGFVASGASAVERDAQDKLRETVSVLDFGAVADATVNTSTGVATGTDNSAAFQAALATGKNVFVPAGSYALADTIALKYDGQSLFGHGTYTTSLVWTGADNTKNMIELWSGRRDTGVGSAAKTGQRLTGLRLAADVSGAVKNAIWIEDGIFHSEVSNIRIANFSCDVAESFIKFDSGGGLSYPVAPVLRDVTMTASVAAGAPAVPVGIFIESLIEGRFDNVKIFNVSDGVVFGSSGTFRTVEDCKFDRLHIEIGDRDNAANDATGLRFYAGGNINFDSLKINCGVNDDAGYPSVTDQTCVEFEASASGKSVRNINFWGCRFWQYALQTRELVYFNSGADASDILFDSCKVVGVTGTVGFIGSASDFDGNIQERNTHFSGMSRAAVLADMRGRDNIVYDAGSLTNAAPGNTETFQLSTDDYSAFGTPVQVSASIDLQGIHLSWYKTSATGVNVFSLWNLPNSSGTINLGSARYARRHFQPDDIRGKVAKLWDPANADVNQSPATTIPFPGVRLGDFVKGGFAARTAGGMASVIMDAWVSADNVVSVRAITPALKNLGNDILTIYHLAPTFDYIASATYDPPSLATLTGASTTVSVSGASMGDFVEVSFSNDQAGVLMWGEVTASGTVTVRLFNATTGTVDLASGTLTVGVRKRHTVL